ncbi:MAG: hypothetical protein KJ607_14775 [Bacteroidetes bacterium]|nr:hypothetical protein [Bacteroidota bacterium]
MQLPNFRIQYIEIPEQFRSYISGKPFENCIACEKYLLDSGTQYFIEKAIRKDEVEVEYAICFSCVEQMRNKMSEESMNKTQGYFQSVVNINERYNKIQADPDPSWKKWIANCLVKGTPITQLEEYQLYAHCDGKYMINSVFPYMVGSAAIEEMQELLSAKTKEELDRFMDEHFGLPPEWKEVLKKDLILI